MKILFVDDMEVRHSSFDQQILSAQLNGVADIWRAYTGERGLKLINEQVFDVMYLDHDLADVHYVEGNGGKIVENNEISGTELAKAVAVLPEERRPKVVVIHSWNKTGKDRMVTALRDANIFYIVDMFSGLLIERTMVHIKKILEEVSENKQ